MWDVSLSPRSSGQRYFYSLPCLHVYIGMHKYVSTNEVEGNFVLVPGQVTRGEIIITSFVWSELLRLAGLSSAMIRQLTRMYRLKTV